MAPPIDLDESVDLPPVQAQEPSSTPIDTNTNNGNNHNSNDSDVESRTNEEKVVSVGEILYGVESFHAIVQPGKSSQVKCI
jgi:hypothetical protein